MFDEVVNAGVNYLKHVLLLHCHIRRKKGIHLYIGKNGILVMAGAIQFHHSAFQVFDLQVIFKVTIPDDDLYILNALKLHSFVKNAIFKNNELVVHQRL